MILALVPVSCGRWAMLIHMSIMADTSTCISKRRCMCCAHSYEYHDAAHMC
jgi:hypothetical protein